MTGHTSHLSVKSLEAFVHVLDRTLPVDSYYGYLYVNTSLNQFAHFETSTAIRFQAWPMRQKTSPDTMLDIHPCKPEAIARVAAEMKSQNEKTRLLIALAIRRPHIQLRCGRIRYGLYSEKGIVLLWTRTHSGTHWDAFEVSFAVSWQASVPERSKQWMVTDNATSFNESVRWPARPSHHCPWATPSHSQFVASSTSNLRHGFSWYFGPPYPKLLWTDFKWPIYAQTHISVG